MWPRVGYYLFNWSTKIWVSQYMGFSLSWRSNISSAFLCQDFQHNFWWYQSLKGVPTELYCSSNFCTLFELCCQYIVAPYQHVRVAWGALRRLCGDRDIDINEWKEFLFHNIYIVKILKTGCRNHKPLLTYTIKLPQIRSVINTL